MSERVHISYDEVPYPSLSFSQTHPDSLAIQAILLGMHPPAIHSCRVLEMGCGVGGNLIPMAYSLPGAQFVGIDAAGREIAEGQSLIAALNLKNIRLEHRDILDVGPEMGQFDYIITHGVFSWVPRHVQDKILEICQRNLAPNGVAYVSYNCYPGWHMLRMVREMMLYSVRDEADPRARASRARHFLGFLAEACSDGSSAYGGFLQSYVETVDGKLGEVMAGQEALLLHDELADINEPIYFYQFAERAAAHGLQYVAEADFHTTTGSTLSPKVRETLDGVAKSVIDLEQYLDFVRNRTLRQTLLCHSDVPLSRVLKPALVMDLAVASRACPDTPQATIDSPSVVAFRGHDGAVLSSDHPVTKAALTYLTRRWPQAVPFDETLAAARSLVERHHELDAEILGTSLLQAYGYSNSLAELHVQPFPLPRTLAERPIASAVARLQARTGDRITNLRHERVRLDELDRFLLYHLDGSRDRAALMRLLMEGPVADGRLSIGNGDGAPSEPPDLEMLLASEVETRLRWLASAALLVESEPLGENVHGPG